MRPQPQPAQAKRVPPEWLQERFNQSDLVERAESGALRRVVRADRPARAGAHQPPGTRSILEQWFDGDVRVAEVHYYRLPDGRLGASGKYDPKGVRVGATWCYVT